MKIELNIGSGLDLKVGLPSLRKIYVLCAVIPFILFWTGITSPLWTDNFIVYVFALAPYYLYIILLNNEWLEGRFLCDTKIGKYASRIWAFNIGLSALSSLFLSFLWTRSDLFLYGVSLMALVNVVPAFVSSLAALFLHKTRYERFPLWAPPAGDG